MNRNVSKITSKHKTKAVLLLVFCMLCGTLTGCTRREAYSFTTYAFDTIIQIEYWGGGKELQEACTQMCIDYEELFSRTVETSDIARINAAGGAPVEVDPETASLIKEAVSFSELTNGAFDISTLPLSALWNIKADTPVIPDKASIEDALSHVDYTKIRLAGTTVTLEDPEMQIDLGGIAKGYISKELLKLLKDNGIEHALINLGGNIAALGGSPEGAAFRIGLQEPFAASGKTLESVNISDGAVVTSGSYERYFEQNGTIYHHIMDPDTGFPSDKDLSAVTIICDDPVMADAMSTACFVLGTEKGTEIARKLGIRAIFIDKNNRLFDTADNP